MDKKQQIEDLNQSIKNLESARDTLQSQLESEKPELRIGACGIATNSCFPRIVLNDGQVMTATGIISERETDKPTVIYFNAFDDLKAMSEDLEEFEMGCDHINRDKIKVYNAGDYIHFAIDTCVALKIPKAQKSHRKLGRVIATAIRKAEKKE